MLRARDSLGAVARRCGDPCRGRKDRQLQKDALKASGQVDKTLFALNDYTSRERGHDHGPFRLVCEMEAKTNRVAVDARLILGPATRDHELVRYVGRHGAVAIEHVMAALGVGRTVAYRCVATCVEAGLLERAVVKVRARKKIAIAKVVPR